MHQNDGKDTVKEHLSNNGILDFPENLFSLAEKVFRESPVGLLLVFIPEDQDQSLQWFFVKKNKKL